VTASQEIIDYIDCLSIPDEGKRSNELAALQYLGRGLWFLYDWVSGIEAKVLESVPKDKRIFHFGESPLMEGIPQSIVACAFHWYAVTACNYVRMVGWLTKGGDSAKANDYLAEVLPQVYVWRNKVAAHFCLLNPHKEDTPADLAMSVMFPISFDDDSFYTGSLSLTMTHNGETSTNRSDMRWSLTHTHRALVPRYWPNADTKHR
jgi:hypothetical protein